MRLLKSQKKFFDLIEAFLVTKKNLDLSEASSVREKKFSKSPECPSLRKKNSRRRLGTDHQEKNFEAHQARR